MFDSSISTPRLGLPLLEAAQAQKHVTHNEALMLIDAAMHLAVVSRRLAAPPQIAEGARYLVPQGATGAWAAQVGKLALAQGGGWLFLTPRTGWRLWVEDERELLVFDGADWTGLPPPEVTATPRLGINATADDVNRLSVASPATLFTHAGSDHRLKLNKNAAGDTASLLYQTGWSGRAEMGLSGDDDFRIKVSADGTGWKDAIVVERATGRVSLPNTPAPPAGSGGTALLFNQSLAAQGPGFAVETYINGSAIAVPAGALQAGTRYRLVIGVFKTAAGGVPPVMRIRFGTTGTLADPAVLTLTFPAQTAAADEGRITIEAIFFSVGAAATVQALGSLTHLLNSTGLAGGPGPARRATSVPFDSGLPGAVLGVSLNAGTAAAWSIWLAQATLENLA